MLTKLIREVSYSTLLKEILIDKFWIIAIKGDR